MAASKTDFKARLKAVYLAQYTGTPSPEQDDNADAIAGSIADEVAIFVDAYVKTSEVSHNLLDSTPAAVTGTIVIDGTTIN